MAEARLVDCPQCGGSTPLPEDLRTQTFHCSFCRLPLRTAEFAGRAAVSADALVGHIRTAVAAPGNAMDAALAAPRFQGGDTSFRAADCRHCGAPVSVPMDLQIGELHCAGCKRTQRVDDYIPNAERFRFDMERQVAGNAALKKLQAEGLACTSCGGKNEVPNDGSVQLLCKFCNTTLMLSAYVDPSALARQRLKQGVDQMRDDVMRQHETKQKHTLLVVLALVAIAVVIGIVAATAG
jgi:hypothetical protein